MTEAEKLDLILNLIKSEIGWLFLDRTRIRPNGYAVGEHVHTMSLAPGEELVMEQKAFTKRQATYEEQNEQERQVRHRAVEYLQHRTAGRTGPADQPETQLVRRASPA